MILFYYQFILTTHLHLKHLKITNFYRHNNYFIWHNSPKNTVLHFNDDYLEIEDDYTFKTNFKDIKINLKNIEIKITSKSIILKGPLHTGTLLLFPTSLEFILSSEHINADLLKEIKPVYESVLENDQFFYSYDHKKYYKFLNFKVGSILNVNSILVYEDKNYKIEIKLSENEYVINICDKEIKRVDVIILDFDEKNTTLIYGDDLVITKEINI